MNLTNCGLAVVFGVLTLLGAGTAVGADREANAQTAEVLGKLHHSNQMEIAAGKVAQDKGQSKDLKAFGKTLVTDHSAADKKVMALAKEEKIDLPADKPMPDDMDKMKAASGVDFDKMFASHMLDDHKKDISEAKAAHDSTTDAKLKALLGATIPVLEKHRDTAQKLVEKLGASASNASTAAPAAAK